MKIIISGEEIHRGGVAIIQDEETAKVYKEFWDVSPRVLLVKFASTFI
jgi:hypothetical protein